MHEVDLRVILQLLPLLLGRRLVVQDYYWADVDAVFSTQWLDEMPDVFYHPTNDYVVFSQFRVFH